MPIDAATPLSHVTFCVLDLETTGTDATFDRITEVGAVRVRSGERLGTFHTMVGDGPTETPVDTMLAHLVEFTSDTVVAGHNVQFDLRFLNAALARSGRPPLDTASVVDTMPLARRLVRDEADDCRLGTLAERFELPHRPSHRAFEDAAATVDLLHLLIERSSAFGVVGLDDLRALPSVTTSRYSAKLRLTTALPRAPGVFVCHDRLGDVVHVGVADELRAEVRAMFASGDRREIAPVLRATERISHVVKTDPLDRALLRVQLLHRHRPPLQRHALISDRAVFVHVDLAARSPRATVVRKPRNTGVHLGPCHDRSTAVRSVEALHQCRTEDRAWSDAVYAATVSHEAAAALVAELRILVDDRRTNGDVVAAAVLSSSVDSLQELFAQHHTIVAARPWSSAPVAGPLPLANLDEVLAISTWRSTSAGIAPAPR